MPGHLKEKLTRSSKKDLLSGSYNILVQKPPKSLPQELSVGHGICKIFMQGPPREDLTRISTISFVKDLCRIMKGPLRKECSRISTKARFPRDFTIKMPQTKSLRIPRRRLWRSLRNRNAHGHATRAILCENLQAKCHGREVRPASCASLRSRNAYMDM